MHDASKVLLGATLSSAKDVSFHDTDPASAPAGQAVSLSNAGALSLLASAGRRIGISLGRSLSADLKTSVCRSGSAVPLALELPRASGIATITAFADLLADGADSLTVGGVEFDAQAGASTPGSAHFTAASSDEATATSLAAQVNAHATANLLVFAVADGDEVTFYAKAAGAAGNALEMSYTNTAGGAGLVLSGLEDGDFTGGSDDYSDIDYAAIGEKAYLNDVNGKGDIAAFGTISDAVYVSAPKQSVSELGALGACILVDMVGGL